MQARDLSVEQRICDCPVKSYEIPLEVYFLNKYYFLGVNILHLITTPFPSVGHTARDDASAVDLPTVKKFNKVFRIFIAEYLGLAKTPYLKMLNSIGWSKSNKTLMMIDISNNLLMAFHDVEWV